MVRRSRFTRTPRARRLALLVILTTAFSSALVAATPAFADSYAGVLGIKSVGSLYAGIDGEANLAATVSRSTSPGGTATFSLEVLNTGTDLAQYQVNVRNDIQDPTPRSSAVVEAGSTNVTSVATKPEPAGFVTGVLAPGKSTTLTLKITVPKTAGALDQFVDDVTLSDPGYHLYLSQVYAVVQVSSSAATTADTILGTANSQATVAGGTPDTGEPLVTAAALSVNQTATYTLTLKNGSAAPAILKFLLPTPYYPCAAASFVTKVLDGSTDVTTRCHR